MSGVPYFQIIKIVTTHSVMENLTGIMIVMKLKQYSATEKHSFNFGSASVTGFKRPYNEAFLIFVKGCGEGFPRFVTSSSSSVLRFITFSEKKEVDN